jgi:RHH-type rel operon transcriptional repressor/antitoxin RelB
MALSVRLDPIIEKRIEQESRRLGITKSEFVKDALERVLGYKDPVALLDEICSFTPIGDPNASERGSEKIKAKLRAKHTG